MSEAKETKAIYPSKAYPEAIGYALACLEKERERTLEAVAGLSLEELDYYAQGFPNSIGTLLYHIADIELDWLYCEILEQAIPKNLASLFPIYTHDKEGKLSAVTGMNLADHLDRLATVRNDLQLKLEGLSIEDFYRVRRFDAYDVNPAWVLYHLLEHEAKHGEQINHICRLITAK